MQNCIIIINSIACTLKALIQICHQQLKHFSWLQLAVIPVSSTPSAQRSMINLLISTGKIGDGDAQLGVIAVAFHSLAPECNSAIWFVAIIVGLAGTPWRWRLAVFLAYSIFVAHIWGAAGRIRIAAVSVAYAFWLRAYFSIACKAPAARSAL